MALGAFASAASAWNTPGRFSCRASALRVSVLAPAVFSEPSVANPAGSPCTDDFDQVANVDVSPTATADLVTAMTDVNPTGGHAESSNEGSTIVVGGFRIDSAVTSAQADSTCLGGSPALTSSSEVVGLRINGGPVITTTSPQTIPLGPVTIYLNRTQFGPGDTVTQRALEVAAPSLGTNVVAGEAIADVERCASVNH